LTVAAARLGLIFVAFHAKVLYLVRANPFEEVMP
jgi:hypothetical protein